MLYFLGIFQTIGVHTLLGLSAYVLLLTGQLSLGQVRVLRNRGLCLRHTNGIIFLAYLCSTRSRRARGRIFCLLDWVPGTSGQGFDVGGRNHRVFRDC